MVKTESLLNTITIFFVPDQKNFEKETTEVIEKIKKEKLIPFKNVVLIFPIQLENYIIQKFSKIEKIKSLSRSKKETVVEI